MLNQDQKRTLASSLADIRKLSLAGQALCRGSANAVEQSAMAAVCNPGKTKDIDAKDRGFLQFQATIDRAQNLLHIMDPEGLASKASFECADAVPRDALIRAEPQDLVGKVAIVNAFRDLSFARTILRALKDKFGPEVLANPGTRTLSDKPKKAKKAQAPDAKAILAAMIAEHPNLTGAEILALMTAPQVVQVAPLAMVAVA